MEIIVTELHKADRDGLPQTDELGEHRDIESVEDFGKFLMRRELEIYDVYKDQFTNVYRQRMKSYFENEKKEQQKRDSESKQAELTTQNNLNQL